ncbi:MAG: single-stranded-DNA-specific exonuclease RecJ [Clostridia bacterium]|jgi:single-stranded-DNA-specific exonuclease
MIQYKSLEYRTDKTTKIKEFVASCGISQVVAEILFYRGIDTPEKALEFLNPSLEMLHDPYSLKDMDKAVERINKAIQENELITIYGDYDVDGVTSTSILLLCLRQLGARVDFYIPSRHDEGYGLNTAAIKGIAEKGTRLIITVDCGIAALEEIDYASSLGIDVIVTDHHQCGVVLPKAIAVINPKRRDQAYPFRYLAGVGVAAKLIQAMGGIESVAEYLDLIAIGTVADVVPLVGENRVFVKFGLSAINQKKRIGISQLVQIAGYDKKEIDAGEIAFGLGPRINAGGRIGHSKHSVILLTTEDVSLARQIAESLNRENEERQRIENEILNQSLNLIDTSIDFQKDKAIILAHEGWHHGVVGIVASRLVERFHRPTILICQDGNQGVGSGRSIPGINLYEALLQSKDLFHKFGGHEQAVGLSIPIDHVQELKERMNQYLSSAYSPRAFVPSIAYDKDLFLEDIHHSLVEDISQLKPFGMGNPSPVFRIPDVCLQWPRKVGKTGAHLKVSVRSETRLMDGIGYKLSYLQDQITNKTHYDLIISPEINEWNGVQNLQCNIKSIRLVQTYENLLECVLRDKDKLMRAFWQQILYNGVVQEKPYQNLRRIQDPNRANHLVLDRLERDVQGTAILVHHEEGYRRLLHLLDSHDLLDWTDFYFGHPLEDPLGYNSVIVAPEADLIDFSKYRWIILWDGILCLDYLLYILSKGKEQTLFLIHGDREAEDIRALIEDIRLDREELGKYYKLFQKHAYRSIPYESFDAFIDYLKRCSNFPVMEWKTRIAMQIFYELGFLTFTESKDEGFRIIMNQISQKKDLAQSSCYRKFNNITSYFDQLFRKDINMLLGGYEDEFEGNNSSYP